MQPPVFRLRSLPTQLREHVLRFLPLYDKLLQLSHLSRDFPRLTPACFSEDDLELDTVVVRALTRSASLLRLLSRVRHVSVSAERWRQGRRADGWELAHCGSVPSLLRCFSQVQRLSVEVDEDWPKERETAIGLQDVLTSLPQLPLLHSLCVTGEPDRRSRRVIPLSELALLAELPSLRSVTLCSMLLAAGSLSLLCSSPLEHLDLRYANLDGAHDMRGRGRPDMTDEPAPPAVDVSFILRRLQLPDPCSPQARKEVRRVLAAYGIDGIGRRDAELRRQHVQLELVDFWRSGGRAVTPELQQLQLRIPSLTALTLNVSLGTSLCPLSPSASPMLSQLRCVSLRISEPALDDDGESVAEDGVGARRRRDWLSEVAADCVGFLHSYSTQLLRLELKRLPSLPAAAPILQAAFHCRQLRRLKLQGGEEEQEKTPRLTAVSFTPLPQLHSLSLGNLDISAAQLTALLRACPAVEHIKLCSMPAFTLELLPVIGRSCRRLMVLDASWCDFELFAHPVEAQLTAAEQSRDIEAVFPQLVALTLRVDEPYSGMDPPPSSSPRLQWLLRLLRSAPVLRFLHLDLHLGLSELLPFSSLTSLRGFMLVYLWDESQRRFFCKRQRDRLPPPDSTDWQPVHEANRERQLVSDFRGWGGLFRDNGEGCQGRTGREAMFTALKARLASGEDESKGELGDSRRLDEEDSKDGESTAEKDDEGDGSNEAAVTEVGKEEKHKLSEEEEGDAQGRKRRRVHNG